MSASRLLNRSDILLKGVVVKQGYRLMVVDKDGVLVSEFQLRESDLADPAAFVAALKESIEQVEEEEP
ncbi:MAG: hypothetical protein K0S45_1543 [Nitrospira sp.]|jgi:hypothetical protein|nr:hypothetical protein [Nitrospira sp.]